MLCAAEGFSAAVEHEVTPDSPLEVRMGPMADGGSLVFPDGAGRLRGIRGRLHPILDRHDRTYLYASNVAINDGETQPVHFALDEALRLTDAYGAGATVWFREMVGASSVFDYRLDPPRRPS